jgi:hypothetical protein
MICSTDFSSMRVPKPCTTITRSPYQSQRSRISLSLSLSDQAPAWVETERCSKAFRRLSDERAARRQASLPVGPEEDV